MDNVVDFKVIDKIIDEHGCKESSIIAILQSINEEYRYLPKEIFPYLSERLRVSIAKVYSVATFYENFSFEPKGKYIIKLCDGTACHVRKSIPILDRLRKDLGLTGDKVTTDDLAFTVETVACVGACGLAPVVMVGETVYAAMTPDKASELLIKLKEEL